MAKISIIIPTLNEASIIKNTLLQVKDRLNGQNAEIIVSVASRSTDATYELASAEACQVIKCSQCSRAAQMNEAARLATGDILFFLHADTLPPVGFGEDIMLAIDQGNNAGLFSYYFDSESTLLKINAYFTKRDSLLVGGGDQGFFINKTIFDKLGGYDESYCIMEDFDMIRRIRKAKIPYTIIDNPALVSARKYEKNSYIRVNLVNLVAMIMFRLGVAPYKIKRFYKARLS